MSKSVIIIFTNEGSQGDHITDFLSFLGYIYLLARRLRTQMDAKSETSRSSESSLGLILKSNLLESETSK